MSWLSNNLLFGGSTMLLPQLCIFIDFSEIIDTMAGEISICEP